MEVTRTTTAANPVERLVRLVALLESLDAMFKRLAKGRIDDEKKLGSEFEELSRTIGTFCEGLAAAAEALGEVNENLASDDGRGALLTRIASQPDFAVSIKKNMAEAERGVRVVDRIMEGVYRLTAQRKLLPRIVQGTARSTVARALTSASVATDRMNDLCERLRGIQKKIADSGLDKRLDAVEIPEVDEPSSSPPVSSPSESETAAAEPASPSEAAERSAEHPAAHPEAAKAPEPAEKPTERGSAPPRRPAPASEAAKPIVSPERFARIRAALNRFSQRRPLVPSHLGDIIQIISAVEERAVAWRILALWGRRPRSESEWELPAPPPEGFTACKIGDIEYAVSELRKADYEGKLPEELLLAAKGREEKETFTAVRARAVDAGLEETCATAVARRGSEYFVREVAEPFLRRPPAPAAGAAPAESDSRLIRTQIESVEVPVLHLVCGFRSPKHPNALARFQVWIYGEDAVTYVDVVPRQWTAKAAGWMAGLLAAGAAAGFILGEILRSLVG
ncbi:MAG: hypothetical protein JXP34_01660 [Planctomycetes bacterium]|nr:hypothetical protein [Planctomycetota bacterium]